MHRTTRGSTGAARRWVAFALVALLLMTGAASAGAFGLELGLALVPASAHAPQLPPDLQIDATWPDRCPPVVDRVTTTPGHIEVHLRASARTCAEGSTPVRFLVNPARAAGWTQLPLATWEVRLYLGRAGHGEELVAFAWLDAGGELAAAKPENGFWWSLANPGQAPALAGSGITLERQEERLAISLLGYEAGLPMWYFGSSNLRGSSVRVQLMRMLGGGGLFDGAGSAPLAEAGPVLHLLFESPARARAWLERPQAGSDRAIELQGFGLRRLAFAPGHAADAWRGRWLLAKDDDDVARIFALSGERTSDADSFTLSDAANAITLDCRLAEPGEHAMPAFCALRDGGTVLATFDRIGLDRMLGQSADGDRVELLRLAD